MAREGVVWAAPGFGAPRIGSRFGHKPLLGKGAKVPVHIPSNVLTTVALSDFPFAVAVGL
jgi:hypothetical protein